MTDLFFKTTDYLAKVLIDLASIGLVLMTVIVGWQVFGRFVLNSSPSWSEQASLILMIWYVSFAAAAGVREGFHIRIVALEEAVPSNIRFGLQIFNEIVVGFCGVAMCIWGGELVLRTWGHVIPSLGISRGFAYLGLPLSGFLIALFSVERILRKMNTQNNQEEM